MGGRNWQPAGCAWLDAPLGQLALVWGQDERHVAKHGAREAQGIVDQHLAQRVGQVLLGPACAW